MARPDRYAVIGHPVAHSKSPAIHSAFAAQTGQNLCYERLLAPLDGFAAAVRTFIEQGGKGLNVTLPFKVEAHALADTLTPRASSAGAVNTLKITDGHILGDNTDGAGLVTDIERNAGVALSGKRILLLGAGGAARGDPAVAGGATGSADHRQSNAGESRRVGARICAICGCDRSVRLRCLARALRHCHQCDLGQPRQ